MAAEGEKLSWKAYASAVRKAVSLPDDDTPIFIASHATVAVPAGDNIVPPAVTNDGIYNVSDALWVGKVILSTFANCYTVSSRTAYFMLLQGPIPTSRNS